jgi:hypothetical protein
MKNPPVLGTPYWHPAALASSWLSVCFRQKGESTLLSSFDERVVLALSADRGTGAMAGNHNGFVG